MGALRTPVRNFAINPIYIYHRYIRKSPDKLTEDYYHGRGEFSPQSADSFDKRIQKNSERTKSA